MKRTCIGILLSLGCAAAGAQDSGSVDFTNKLTGRIEWQRYFDVDFVARKTDTDVLSIGLAYRFR